MVSVCWKYANLSCLSELTERKSEKSHVPTLSGVGHGTFYAEKICCSAGKMGIDKDRMVLYNRSK